MSNVSLGRRGRGRFSAGAQSFFNFPLPCFIQRILPEPFH